MTGIYSLEARKAWDNFMKKISKLNFWLMIQTLFWLLQLLDQDLKQH